MRAPTDVIDELLALAEGISAEDDRKKIEDAVEVLVRAAGDRGKYGPFDSSVVAIGRTYYASIGEAVRVLDLAPRQRVKITVERF